MADAKISALTELTVPPDPTDEFVVVDKSDTSEAASGTDKRIKYQTLGDQGLMGGGPLVPTGVTYQNFSRYQTTAGSAQNTSGTMRLSGIWLPAGFTVTSISFVSIGGLTLGTSPHFWVALYDSSRNLLRQSTDDTAAAWAATALKTVNLSSTFVTTYTGLHYTGFLISQTGGTIPTLLCATVTASLTNFAPSLTGNSTTGLTATAPNPAAAISAGATNAPWCGVA